jgi:hypothetical protein
LRSRLVSFSHKNVSKPKRKFLSVKLLKRQRLRQTRKLERSLLQREVKKKTRVISLK